MPKPFVKDISQVYKLVQGKHGFMLANQHDKYIGQALITYGECGEMELQLLKQLVKNLDKNVVEVGANIGTFTIPLAKMMQDKNLAVIAFEPQPFIFHNLCANLALNDLTNVEAWPFACSDAMGQVYFKVPTYRRLGNFGGVEFKDEHKGKMASIPCVTLDHALAGTSVGLLKVDVEGFELRVLMGAENIIAENRPILYVENDREELSKDLIEYIENLNYKLWWHMPAMFNEKNFYSCKENMYDFLVSFNMLCLPAETNPKVSNLIPITNFSLEKAKEDFMVNWRAKRNAQ